MYYYLITIVHFGGIMSEEVLAWLNVSTGWYKARLHIARESYPHPTSREMALKLIQLTTFLVNLRNQLDVAKPSALVAFANVPRLLKSLMRLSFGKYPHYGSCILVLAVGMRLITTTTRVRYKNHTIDVIQMHCIVISH